MAGLLEQFLDPSADIIAAQHPLAPATTWEIRSSVSDAYVTAAKERAATNPMLQVAMRHMVLEGLKPQPVKQIAAGEAELVTTPTETEESAWNRALRTAIEAGEIKPIELMTNNQDVEDALDRVEAVVVDGERMRPVDDLRKLFSARQERDGKPLGQTLVAWVLQLSNRVGEVQQEAVEEAEKNSEGSSASVLN